MSSIDQLVLGPSPAHVDLTTRRTRALTAGRPRGTARSTARTAPAALLGRQRAQVTGEPSRPLEVREHPDTDHAHAQAHDSGTNGRGLVHQVTPGDPQRSVMICANKVRARRPTDRCDAAHLGAVLDELPQPLYRLKGPSSTARAVGPVHGGESGRRRRARGRVPVCRPATAIPTPISVVRLIPAAGTRCSSSPAIRLITALGRSCPIPCESSRRPLRR